MPASQSLVSISFHGDTIYAIEHQGEPFAPVRPIVENLRLEWSAQRQKLTANSSRWGVSIIDTPSAGGLQKTLCIPVRKLAGFLATINPNKVRNELRAKIIRYQNECDDALWNYWTKGEAKRPESSTFEPAQPDLPLGLQESPEEQLLLQGKYIKLLESHVELLEKLSQHAVIPGAGPIKKKRVCRPVTPSEAEGMRMLYRAGVSRYKIAKRFNRGRTTVTKYTVGECA